MSEYRMEMTITSATGDADHFYNTVLMIAKGFEIGVIESRIRPLTPKDSTSTQPPVEKETVKKVFSIKEAAEYVNLSKATIYKFAREDKIPHFKIGKRVLFKTKDLEEWLENQKVKKR